MWAVYRSSSGVVAAADRSRPGLLTEPSLWNRFLAYLRTNAVSVDFAELAADVAE